MKDTFRLRPAIAMIELIFALVIMGITLMSAPMLLNTSVQSGNTATQQEAIAATASQISLVLTYPWDQNTTSAITGYGILRVANGDPELDQGTRNDAEDMLFRRAYNAAPFDLATPINAAGAFPADPAPDRADIDDFDGQVQNVAVYAGENASINNNEGEYIRGNNFTLTTQIQYYDGGANNINYTNNNITFNNIYNTILGAGSSNVKLISVNFQDTTGTQELNTSISLHAFTCNIGTAAPQDVTIN